MYSRKSNSNHSIDWNPEDADLAAQAMEDVSGTGVPDMATLPDEANVDLDDVAPQYDRDPDQVAQDVRERYAELHVEKYGQDSRFYDETA